MFSKCTRKNKQKKGRKYIYISFSVHAAITDSIFCCCLFVFWSTKPLMSCD